MNCPGGTTCSFQTSIVIFINNLVWVQPAITLQLAEKYREQAFFVLHRL